MQELIETYYKILQIGSVQKFYQKAYEDADENTLENVNKIKKLEQNGGYIVTISLNELLEQLAQITVVKKDTINVKIDVVGSEKCPPLTLEEYLNHLPQNKAIIISINYPYLAKRAYSNIFSIEFYSKINLNELDYKDNPILTHAQVRVYDEKEPTSVLTLNVNPYDIPLIINLKTFDDIYYSSFSEENAQIFIQAICNCIAKQKALLKK